jgi:hypothetical protein
VLRRVGRRGLRQQLYDRSRDLKPERPSLLDARLHRLLGGVLRRVGTAPADKLISGAVALMLLETHWTLDLQTRLHI